MLLRVPFIPTSNHASATNRKQFLDIAACACAQQKEDYIMADDMERNRQQGQSGQPGQRGQGGSGGQQQSGQSGQQPGQKKSGYGQDEEDNESRDRQRRAS
jgi:hypothetical protein